MNQASKPAKAAPANAVTTVGLFSAIAVLLTLQFLGHKYKNDCLAAGKDFEQCWEKGLTIAGMNAGGPVSAVAIVGYLIGQANKEKEKAENISKVSGPSTQHWIATKSPRRRLLGLWIRLRKSDRARVSLPAQWWPACPVE